MSLSFKLEIQLNKVYSFDFFCSQSTSFEFNGVFRPEHNSDLCNKIKGFWTILMVEGKLLIHFKGVRKRKNLRKKIFIKDNLTNEVFPRGKKLTKLSQKSNEISDN